MNSDKGIPDEGETFACTDLSRDDAFREGHATFLRAPNAAERERINGGWTFGDYFKSKQARLRNQGPDKLRSRILEGVKIFVTGDTETSRSEVRELIRANGGTFLDYDFEGNATHWVAEELSASKILSFREKYSRIGLKKKPPKVVSSRWLFDSLEQGKLMPDNGYILTELTRGSSNMDRFLQSTSHLPCSNPCQDAPEASDGVMSPNKKRRRIDGHDSSKSPVPQSSRCEPQSNVGSGEALDDVGDGRAEGDSANENSHSHDPRPGTGPAEQVQGTYGANETPGGENKISPKKYSKRTGKDAILKSTEDGFIDQFYNNSRLHFLGSFRSRMQDYNRDLIREANQRRDRGGGKQTAQRQWRKGDEDTNRIVIHIDMDCFFVAVSTRDRPDLQQKPVAVAHTKAKNAKAESYCEISSVNYPAREYGLRNGMFLKDALEKCPMLETVGYDFEEYEDVSKEIYRIFHSYTPVVQAESVDEAYLEIRGTLQEGLNMAENIRSEIFQRTRCTATAGVSHNILLAKLSTSKAKPNGLGYIPSERSELLRILGELPLRKVPGVGWSLGKQLKALNLETCGQIVKDSWTVDSLKANGLGTANALTIFNACHGLDDRELKTSPERKSIAAEVNWGIRFTEHTETEEFLIRLAGELSRRMKECRVIGTKLTLKLKVRSLEAKQESRKFLGHGISDDRSKTVTLKRNTDDEATLRNQSLEMYRDFAKAMHAVQVRGIGLSMGNLLSTEGTGRGDRVTDHFGKLGPMAGDEPGAITMRGQEIMPPPALPQRNLTSDNAGTSNANHAAGDMMSMSQVDPSILSELPDEIREQVQAMYPAHRNQDAEGASKKGLDARYINYVDPDYIRELPTQDRKEIVTAIKFGQAQRGHVKPVQKRPVDSDESDDNIEEAEPEKQDDLSGAIFSGPPNEESIRRMILDWLSTSGQSRLGLPRLELLSQYMQHLVNGGRGDVARSMLLCLRRGLGAENEDFRALLDKIQSVYARNYQCQLLL